MKNLFLAVVTLFTLNTFAQRIEVGPWNPGPLYSCKDYTLYACDENGVEITNIRNPKYVQYIVEICQEQPQGHGIFYTILQQVVDQLCKEGTIIYAPNVTIKKITKSPFGNYTPLPPGDYIIAN